MTDCQDTMARPGYGGSVSDERGNKPLDPTERVPVRPLVVNPVRPVEPVHLRADATNAYLDAQTANLPPKGTDSEHVAVREVMTRPAITLDAGASLAEAAALMTSRRIDHLPITSDQLLVGLVTRGDLVDRMLRFPEGWRALPVDRVMTSAVVTIGPAQSLREAAQVLIDSHHGGLPVVSPERLVVGFLAARDVLKVLVRRAPLSLWV